MKCRHDQYTPGCHRCDLMARDRRYFDLWGGWPKGGAAPPLPPRVPVALPVARRADCIHLGPVLARADSAGRRRLCQSCWLRACDMHGECRVNEAWAGANCQTCPDYQSDRTPPDVPTPAGAATLPIRFDETNLCPGLPDKRFNSSIIDHRGGYAFAFRTGWRGSDVYVVQLDAAFRPAGEPVKLEAGGRRDCGWGREDPRLFRFGGALHVSFVGVVGRWGPTNVLFARLDDEFRTEDVFHPAIPGRKPGSWEKNHAYFQHGDECYAVYSIVPHRILRVRGNWCEFAYDTPTPAPWSGGHLRGGASPVKVGNEWYCFFHGKDDRNPKHITYSVGCYTFEDRPPFRVRRITPEPLMVADWATKPADQYCACLFPCGAVRRESDWVVSMGVHDRWSELHAFDAADVESRLVRVGTPDWWADRPGTVDLDVFWHVRHIDEYRLGGMRFNPGDAVIDVGGHVGSFAYTAWERGSRNVHVYEPAPWNLDLLRANAAYLPGVAVYGEAVGAGPLYVHRPAVQPENTGASYCTADPSGLPVPAVSLDDAIRRAGGSAALVKVDCETGEADILRRCTLLANVGAVVGEWHTAAGPGELAGVLTAAGFAVETTGAPPWSAGLFFARRRSV